MALFTEEEKTLRRIEKRFAKGVVEYGLIEEGDKILIGLSGGKDSLALVELLARRSRILETTVFGGCCPCGNEKYLLSERYGLPQKLCGVAGSAFRAVRNGVRCEYGYPQVSLFPVFVEPAQGFVHCGKGTGV